MAKRKSATVIQFRPKPAIQAADPNQDELVRKIMSKPKLITEQEWAAVLSLAILVRGLHADTGRAVEWLNDLERSFGVNL
jgi:hypothetical protein